MKSNLLSFEFHLLRPPFLIVIYGLLIQSSTSCGYTPQPAKGANLEAWHRQLEISDAEPLSHLKTRRAAALSLCRDGELSEFFPLLRHRVIFRALELSDPWGIRLSTAHASVSVTPQLTSIRNRFFETA